MRVNAYAKINLSLDILGIREDGYHDLSSVMQSISLCDIIDIELNTNGKIILSCDKDNIPLDSRNTMYRAAEKVLKKLDCGSDIGVTIKLSKAIPSEAGLGGGSADASSVITALNELLGNKLNDYELIEIASAVGADVPFCIHGGTALCEGIGERLSILDAMPDCMILIAKPDVGVSTKEAYAAIDRFPEYFGNRNTENVISALRASSLSGVASAVGNLFDDTLCIPEVQDIKAGMLACGAMASSMSGSGSAVFGIFADADKAKSCMKELKEKCNVFICQPVKAY